MCAGPFAIKNRKTNMSVHSAGTAASMMPVWRFSWGLACAGLLVAGLSVWPFWDGLAQMWAWWAASPEDSFGVLIPPIAAFLMWQQKDRLERMPFTGSWWGIAVILLGGVSLLIGQLGTVFTIVQYAYVITLYGLILSFLGARAFRVIAVPLLVLWFMIPLPQFVVANLSTELQLLSSQIGVYVIRLFGISVFLEGNVIDLGGYKLQVADACSGLRYLFPLMTIGFLMACFYKGAPWKRVVLFLSSVPITVFMNSLRIGIIGVTVEHWGIEMADGFLHEFQGWMIFMISAALMIAEIAALNRIGREAGTWRQLFGVEFPARTPAGVPVQKRAIPTSFIAAGAVMAIFVAVTFALPRAEEIYPARTSFEQFPMQMGEWRGHRSSLEGVYSDALKLDDYVLADYADQSGHIVNVYIAFYNSQRKGEAAHSPRSCLPGGGWQMRNFGQIGLPNAVVNGRPLRVNRTLIEMGNQRQLVYYWFQQRGRVITNEFAVKWYLFWDALTAHRTDGAMVRIITPLSATTPVASADRDMTDLISRMAPGLVRYVPN
jgi:exosortase D (VPLPA-CTERM-specific)